MDSNNTEWTTIIKAKQGWFNLNLKEALCYRDLIFLFVKRDFVAYYQQTILGPLWYIIQPLLSTIIFTIIFGNIAKIPTDGIPQPLFYMGGLALWNYFSTCLISTSSVFTSNSGIFGKVYFPRITVPISNIISNFLIFSLQFFLFFCFYIYYYINGANIHINYWILMIPLLILQSALLGLGFGIVISSLTTKYRDLKYLVSFGIQLWMYATPIVYPISQVPEKWRSLYSLNPMSQIIEMFRYAFLNTGNIKINDYFISLTITIIILFFGLLLFNKVEKSFMDKV
jgi:lipopolysaccharide transport system permease protein